MKFIYDKSTYTKSLKVLAVKRTSIEHMVNVFHTPIMKKVKKKNKLKSNFLGSLCFIVDCCSSQFTPL